MKCRVDSDLQPSLVKAMTVTESPVPTMLIAATVTSYGIVWHRTVDAGLASSLEFEPTKLVLKSNGILDSVISCT